MIDIYKIGVYQQINSEFNYLEKLLINNISNIFNHLPNIRSKEIVFSSKVIIIKLYLNCGVIEKIIYLDEYNDEELMLKIQHYLEIGAIRIAGFTEDGEALFELNEDVTAILAPELWYAHEDYVESELIELLNNDLMQVEYDENLRATYNFTEEGYQIAKEKGIIPIDQTDFEI
jgi:hypothetical protein